MTNEEVFKIIQDAITKIQRGNSGSTELLEVALEAIGKQIPVKPIPVWSAEDVTKISGYMCPKCGSAMVTVGRAKLKACNECFQVLDWSDESTYNEM